MKPTNCAPPTVPFIWFVNVFISLSPATTPARFHSISVLKSQILKLPFFLKIDGEKWSRKLYFEILQAPSEVLQAGRNKPAFLADF